MSTPDNYAEATDQSVTSNLRLLQLKLALAEWRTADALGAAQTGKHNLAIGTIIDLEQLLPEIEALYKTVLLLHRGRSSFEQNEVHS
jgi:hypothetical protein